LKDRHFTVAKKKEREEPTRVFLKNSTARERGRLGQLRTEKDGPSNITSSNQKGQLPREGTKLLGGEKGKNRRPFEG